MRVNTWCMLVLVGATAGCQERGADGPDAQTTEPPTWQEDPSGRWVVPLDITNPNPELLAAIEEGRSWSERTREAARNEWNGLLPVEQQQWAILWAAPTITSEGMDTELLWVIPITWTEHRVEATLASAPGHRTDLVLGQLIGFPIEELADWADYSTNPPRGNEVLKAIEKVIGRAPREGT